MIMNRNKFDVFIFGFLLLLTISQCSATRLITEGHSVSGSLVNLKNVAILKPCERFEQQLLTIVKGLLYAKRSNYTLVIPPFQEPGCKNEQASCAVGFSSCFDKEAFLEKANTLGYSVYIRDTQSVQEPDFGEDAKTLSCTFPFPYDLLDDSARALELLTAFRPAAHISTKLKLLHKKLVYIHLEAKEAKDALTSILSNPVIVLEQKALKFAAFDSKCDHVDLALESEAAADINIDWRTWNTMQASALHYFYALHAKYFFGSSASEFASLVITHRRALDRWAATFNAGVLHPLEVQLLDPLVWVFTYNSWSKGYDYMLQGVVLSALSFGYKPFCMYGGKNHTSIHNWLVEMNITILYHDPEWADKLWNAVIPFKAQNMKHSHLYASKNMVVGTWQRIDLPILRELQQYTFILFTDCDVFFSQRITLLDFKDILPVSALMGPEMMDFFPWNAGVMLMNIPYLRSTYKEFLAYILSNKDGMYFKNFGPGDQGAYNSFYEKSLRPLQLPKIFNAKPYQPVLVNAKLVHFHGPKPHHYLKYFESGDCEFGSLCRQGFEGALCSYVSSYFNFTKELTVPRHLNLACKSLASSKRHLDQKSEK